MKNQFNQIKESVLIGEVEGCNLIHNVSDFVSEIIEDAESRFIDISKSFSSYGTWKSTGWASSAYYGSELSSLIEKAITGRITHDEDHEFEIKDFNEALMDTIYNHLYFLDDEK